MGGANASKRTPPSYSRKTPSGISGITSAQRYDGVRRTDTWCARRSAPARPGGARVDQLQLGPVARASKVSSSARWCGRCSPCPGVKQAAGQQRSTWRGNGARRTLTRCPHGGLYTLGRPLLLRFSDGARRSLTRGRSPRAPGAHHELPVQSDRMDAHHEPQERITCCPSKVTAWMLTTSPRSAPRTARPTESTIMPPCRAILEPHEA